MKAFQRGLVPVLVLLIAASCSMTEGDPPPLTEAEIEAMRVAAESGDPEAQFQFAEVFDKGETVEGDEAVAAIWYRKAAEQGHTSAQFHMGEYCAGGLGGVAKSEEEAIKWYRLAAEKGDVTAQFNLGAMMYAEGERQDFGEALRWFRGAASKGDSDALYSLGVMYEMGQGVLQDDEQALAFYRQAADQDHITAKYAVGTMYESGLGVKRDMVEAIRWYRIAADDPFTPDPDAQNDLAWIYATCHEENLRDGRKAARYALMANAQQPMDPFHKDTLAAAYARNAWYEDAIAAEETAIALAEASEDLDDEERDEIVAEFRERLELYRQGKAYVQPEEE